MEVSMDRKYLGRMLSSLGSSLALQRGSNVVNLVDKVETKQEKQWL